MPPPPPLAMRLIPSSIISLSPPTLNRRHHRYPTSPLIWFAAIFCSILAVAIIIASLVIFIAYLVIKPKVPRIAVTAAQLDVVYLDQSSLLTVQVTVVVRAENHNAHVQAWFYNTNFGLFFRDRKRIATLQAAPFSVGANSSVELNYVAQSGPIPLSPEEAEEVSRSSLQGRGKDRNKAIKFEVIGRMRTRWRVWVIRSAKFWLLLDCRLNLPVNGSRLYPSHCTSTYQ